MDATTHRPPVAPTVLDLLERSRASLLLAAHSCSVSDRYVGAHLAALRAAAALLAARSRPSRRSRPRSVWEVLPAPAPELGEWAAFFASTARRRAALERGGVAISSREADDLLRQAETFVELVRGALGLPPQQPLPELLPVPPLSAPVLSAPRSAAPRSAAPPQETSPSSITSASSASSASDSASAVPGASDVLRATG